MDFISQTSRKMAVVKMDEDNDLSNVK